MNSLEMTKVLPTETELTRPFWEGCRSGELRMQHCDDCDRLQFYPRVICTQCDGNNLSWRAVSGNGRVTSYTVVRRGISPAYTAPYVVALIELDEGPCMMSNVVDCDPDTVVVGAVVEVRFESWTKDHVLPVFTLRAAG